jgi:hypothetical protein
MWRTTRGVPGLLAGVAAAFTIYAGGPIGCEPDRPTVRSAAPARTSATIYFEREAADLGLAALTDLHPIGTRAMSGPSTVRVLVLGFANERHELADNLELAERRARTVARQLAAWSVLEHQITVAATESSSDDEKGARCEIHLADTRGEPHLALCKSNRGLQAESDFAR